MEVVLSMLLVLQVRLVQIQFGLNTWAQWELDGSLHLQTRLLRPAFLCQDLGPKWCISLLMLHIPILTFKDLY